MKDSKHTVDFRELENGALYASFSSGDRELLERALMFIYRSFPEFTESTACETGYIALVMRDPKGGCCTIHAYSSGEIAVAIDHRTGCFLMSDFTGADVSLQIKQDGLVVSLKKGSITNCFMWSLTMDPIEDVEQIASEFREEFSK